MIMKNDCNIKRGLIITKEGCKSGVDLGVREDIEKALKDCPNRFIRLTDNIVRFVPIIEMKSKDGEDNGSN